MSSSGESNESPNWAEMNQNQEQQHFARRVRIMVASGKSVPEIGAWLQQNGCSDADAARFLKEVRKAKRKGRWARRCGWTLFAVAGVFSVSLTLLFHPWTESWETSTGRPVDPLTAVVYYWCGGLMVFTILCGGVGRAFGMLIDWMGELP